MANNEIDIILAQSIVNKWQLQNKHLSNFIITIMKLKIGFFIGIFSVVFSACTDIDLDAVAEKEVIEILGVAMQSPESDEAVQIANTVMDDYLKTIQVQSSGRSKVATMVAMPTVELISAAGVYPESYVIDFGDGYYMDSSGRTIMGKIYFTKSDKVGTIRTYTFSEFYMDKINIKSYRSVNRKANYELEITANDTITLSNGGTYIREWERTRKLIDSNGDVTQYWANSYEYTGNAKGTTLTNAKYQMQIQKPLVSIGEYKYYVSGVVKILTDRGEQFIDFGDGEKDNIAIIKTNGKEKEVVLNWE